MAYWLDSKDEEWGFAGATEEKGIRVAEARHDQKTLNMWVDHFVELVEDKKTIRVIEDRAEFEFLYRCLERIGRPLAFSPIVPSIETDTKRLLNQAA